MYKVPSKLAKLPFFLNTNFYPLFHHLWEWILKNTFIFLAYYVKTTPMKIFSLLGSKGLVYALKCQVVSQNFTFYIPTQKKITSNYKNFIGVIKCVSEVILLKYYHLLLVICAETNYGFYTNHAELNQMLIIMDHLSLPLSKS